jgi:hypothetical protein
VGRTGQSCVCSHCVRCAGFRGLHLLYAVLSLSIVIDVLAINLSKYAILPTLKSRPRRRCFANFCDRFMDARNSICATRGLQIRETKTWTETLARQCPQPDAFPYLLHGNSVTSRLDLAGAVLIVKKRGRLLAPTLQFRNESAAERSPVFRDELATSNSAGPMLPGETLQRGCAYILCRKTQ